MPEATDLNLPSAKSNKTSKHVNRACESCRAHKIRCQPAQDGSTAALQGKCQRCADALRDCVFKEPSRTRAKRTDVRVRELEREVKVLNDLLRTDVLPKAPHAHGPQSLACTESRTSLHRAEAGLANKKRKMVVEQQNVSLHQLERRNCGPVSSPPCPSRPSDVVDIGILTMDEAIKLFEIYVNRMLPHRPLVVFPEETTAASLRLQKPILFLAVLAAAAGTINEQLGMILHQHIQQAFAEHLVIRAEKSLELIQAILVSTNWTYCPDSFEELNFYQYLHMAATMAIELGLDGNYVGKDGRGSRGDVDSGKSGEHFLNESTHRHDSEKSVENIECRRTLLACYICCASVSFGFHRPKAYRFTAYMAESVEALETSRYAGPTDKRLAAWARLQSIMDLSADSLRLNEHANVDALTESQIQLNIKNCFKQLQDWEKSLSPAVKNDCLYISSRFFVCLLHESGLYTDYDPGDFKPPYSTGKLRIVRPEKASGRTVFTPNHISSIMACMSSAHSLLDTFLSMSSHSLQFSPVIVIIRAVYAIFLLSKISISASTLNGNLNQILDPSALKLPFYLQQLELKLDEVASLGCRLAAKFYKVTTKLQQWLGAETHSDFRDTRRPEDLELIQPLKLISLGTEDSTPTDREEADLLRVTSSTNYKPTPGNTDTFGLKYLEDGRSSLPDSGNSMPSKRSANATQNDGRSSAGPSGNGVLPSDPSLADYWLSDWSAQYPTDLLPALGLTLDDEFFDPSFDFNLGVNHGMNNSGGEDPATDIPADLPFLPSMNHVENQVDNFDELQLSNTTVAGPDTLRACSEASV